MSKCWRVLYSPRSLALLVFLTVLLCDQLTKSWVMTDYIPYLPSKLTSFLNLTLAFNSGAAFSFLSGPQQWHTWFFIIFAMLASIYLLLWLVKLKKNQYSLAVALSLILAGAISNLYDRLTLGQVVDFIDVHYYTYHWPIFNVADSAICVGVVLLFFVSEYFSKEK